MVFYRLLLEKREIKTLMFSVKRYNFANNSAKQAVISIQKILTLLTCFTLDSDRVYQCFESTQERSVLGNNPAARQSDEQHCHGVWVALICHACTLEGGEKSTSLQSFQAFLSVTRRLGRD